VTSWTEKILHI